MSLRTFRGSSITSTTQADCTPRSAISVRSSSRINTPGPWSKPQPDPVYLQGRTPRSFAKFRRVSTRPRSTAVQRDPNTPARKIARSVHEAAHDKARTIARTEAYAVSRRERKKVEMLFAHLKRILGLDKLRLRG